MTSMEMTMDNNGLEQKSGPRDSRFSFADIFVILLCISGAAFSLNMFRLDLFQSIALLNKKPMGTVTVKRNNVQRRFSDRVLWSRLAVESPVYSGDLIRAAEYSAATLRINDNVIDINENTLIRIRASTDGENRIIIDFGSGSLSITSPDAVESAAVGGAVGNAVSVALNVMGRVAVPRTGTTLSASSGEDGTTTVQVNKGSVFITEKDGQNHFLTAGETVNLDTDEVQQVSLSTMPLTTAPSATTPLPSAAALPAAIVTQPLPNVRFVKNGVEPLNIRFAWNVVNIGQTQPLRVDIAADRNFTRLARTIEGAGFANTVLDAGTWHWRLSYHDAVMSAGQFTIADAEVSALVSPIQDSLFRYQGNLPAVRFEWQPVEGASYYILQAGLTPDLTNPLITRQTAVASVVESDLGAGTWYWRVKPVFSSLYEGDANFSSSGSFRVENVTTAARPASADTLIEKRISPSVTLALPEPASAPSPEPAVVPKPATAPVSKPASPLIAASPPAPLPEAKNLLPAAGQPIQFEDLRTKRRIDFSWSPVAGANAYIFTLYQQNADGKRRQITQTAPLQKTAWTLDKLALLDRGTFVWRVEAVNVNRNGKIERRGTTTESTFIVDIPVSASVEIEDIGVFYDH